MDALDGYRNEIDRHGARFEEIDAVYQEVKEQHQETWQAYQEAVVDALEEVRDGIDEPVTLVEVAERGRMNFEYEERLTADGIETSDGGFNDWAGAVGPEEYFSMPYRGTREHVEKVADRIRELDDEPPEITYPVPN